MKDILRLLTDFALLLRDSLLPRLQAVWGPDYELFWGSVSAVLPIGYLIAGLAGDKDPPAKIGFNVFVAASGFIGVINDFMRIWRVPETVIDSAAFSLVILAGSDIVTNELEAGITFGITLKSVIPPPAAAAA